MVENIKIVDYEEHIHWLPICQLHDRARPFELEGSCDARAFIPLAEDKADHADFEASTKHVAMYENKIAGFVGTRDNEITWLYVEPSLFGNGIGRLLLRKGLSDISGKSWLYVLDGNKNAISLYESEGFSVVERIPGKENGFDCTTLKLSQTSR